ncbi:MAG: hypothetical protein GC155_02390 [Alphaproteobacteria bacterium]|nr:hypothetical protein [Alphaproteobacteria bacterium]
MAFNKIWLMAAASLAALGACSTAPDASGAKPHAMGKAATGSVLDAGITAAGGEAALSKVKELYWTGHATVTAAGKTSEVDVRDVVRPFTYARFGSWPTDKSPIQAITIQVEQNKAWEVRGSNWGPMPEDKAKNENDQMALFSMMLLAPLKASDAMVKEQPAAGGTRAIQATYMNHSAELEFNASNKLVKVGGMVANPDGGADITQVATLTGEVESNGVKWPKHIAITRNGAPWMDIDIATFEALPEPVIRPMEQTMQNAPPPKGDIPVITDAG